MQPEDRFEAPTGRKPGLFRYQLGADVNWAMEPRRILNLFSGLFAAVAVVGTYRWASVYNLSNTGQ